ncbi:response regulator [Patescibacteria group bacterium]|nr:response regulator [Patescibacteria group bacterium]
MAKILIVDDDANIRWGIGKFLEAFGHQIETAINGIDALSQLKKAPYDIVLSDKSMPEMNGVTLLKRVQRDYPETRTILMSGGGFAEKDPGDLRVHKPFDFKTMLSIISALCAKKRQPA